MASAFRHMATDVETTVALPSSMSLMQMSQMNKRLNSAVLNTSNMRAIPNGGEKDGGEDENREEQPTPEPPIVSGLPSPNLLPQLIPDVSPRILPQTMPNSTPSMMSLRKKNEVPLIKIEESAELSSHHPAPVHSDLFKENTLKLREPLRLVTLKSPRSVALNNTISVADKKWASVRVADSPKNDGSIQRQLDIMHNQLRSLIANRDGRSSGGSTLSASLEQRVLSVESRLTKIEAKLESLKNVSFSPLKNVPDRPAGRNRLLKLLRGGISFLLIPFQAIWLVLSFLISLLFCSKAEPGSIVKQELLSNENVESSKDLFGKNIIMPLQLNSSNLSASRRRLREIENEKLNGVLPNKEM